MTNLKFIGKDICDPSEKKSEHDRRLSWLEKMDRAPVCCKLATNMTGTGDVFHCNSCGRTWEQIGEQMICTG
jgi:hypothetical protein